MQQGTAHQQPATGLALAVRSARGTEYTDQTRSKNGKFHHLFELEGDCWVACEAQKSSHAAMVKVGNILSHSQRMEDPSVDCAGIEAKQGVV